MSPKNGTDNGQHGLVLNDMNIDSEVPSSGNKRDFSPDKAVRDPLAAEKSEPIYDLHLLPRHDDGHRIIQMVADHFLDVHEVGETKNGQISCDR